MTEPRWTQAFAPRTWALVWVPVLVITALHYLTGGEHHQVWIHDLLRRLYHLPLILAAFIGGWRVSAVAASVVVLLYFPHAFSVSGHQDPGRGLEKALEIVLYYTVALVTGWLVDRERAEREEQVRLAQRLSATLEERDRMAQQLVRSSRLEALGELTAGIAHEIKNPLHALRGTAEIVEGALPVGSEEAGMMRRHLGEIDRLDGVLEGFLSFARPRPPQLLPLDLKGVIDHCVELMQAQAHKEGVRIENGVLPPGVMVEGDLDQLVQVLLGIAINGLQSMRGARGGSMSFGLRSDEEAHRHWQVVSVSNSGPPVPEALLERIFDPFVSTRPEGTGLGLAVASRIIEAHGGYVVAQNIGTPPHPTFEIWLPAAD